MEGNSAKFTSSEKCQLIFDDNRTFLGHDRNYSLCMFGSGERHSELTEEMYIPLRPVPKEDTLHG